MLLEILSVITVILLSHMAFHRYVARKDPVVNPEMYKKQQQQQQNGTDSESESDSDSGKDAPRITILYGSQSGTAEGFAEELQEEAKKKGFKAKAVDIEDYDRGKLGKEELMVFCQATYGEGQSNTATIYYHNIATAIILTCICIVACNS